LSYARNRFAHCIVNTYIFARFSIYNNL